MLSLLSDVAYVKINFWSLSYLLGKNCKTHCF
jgi:hypothetical protein